jgi:hypothetical protein
MTPLEVTREQRLKPGILNYLFMYRFFGLSNQTNLFAQKALL